LVSWFVGWSVGGWAGSLVSWFIGWSVSGWAGSLVSWLAGLVGQSVIW